MSSAKRSRPKKFIIVPDELWTSGISNNAVIAYLEIRRYAWEPGGKYTRGYGEIAHALAVKSVKENTVSSTVQRAINELKKIKAIEVIPQYGHKPPIITLLPDEGIVPYAHKGDRPQVGTQATEDQSECPPVITLDERVPTGDHSEADRVPTGDHGECPPMGTPMEEDDSKKTTRPDAPTARPLMSEGEHQGSDATDAASAPQGGSATTPGVPGGSDGGDEDLDWEEAEFNRIHGINPTSERRQWFYFSPKTCTIHVHPEWAADPGAAYLQKAIDRYAAAGLNQTYVWKQAERARENSGLNTFEALAAFLNERAQGERIVPPREEAS